MSEEKASVLFVCYTPLQVLFALQIKRCFLRNADVEIGISDAIGNAGFLEAGLKRTGLFQKVRHIKNKKRKTFWGKLWEVLSDVIQIGWLKMTRRYTEIVFANLSVYNILLTWAYKNTRTELSLFEDGMSFYVPEFASGDDVNTVHRKVLNKDGVLAQVKKIYAFYPQLIAWDIPQKAEVIQVEKIVADAEYKGFLETLYGKMDMGMPDSWEVLFFEESYSVDGFDVPDVEIVKKMAEIVGGAHVGVKLHPRTRVNRFAQDGIQVFRQSSIPFEALLYMRSEDHPKWPLFVTIASGAVVNAYLYFSIPVKSVILMDAIGGKRFGAMGGNLGGLMQKIFRENETLYQMPTNLDVFYETLRTRNAAQ